MESTTYYDLRGEPISLEQIQEALKRVTSHTHYAKVEPPTEVERQAVAALKRLMESEAKEG